MSEERLPNITPGEILQEEFLIPMGTTAYREYDLRDQEDELSEQLARIPRARQGVGS